MVSYTPATGIACPVCTTGEGDRCSSEDGKIHPERSKEAARITREANRKAREAKKQ